MAVVLDLLNASWTGPHDYLSGDTRSVVTGTRSLHRWLSVWGRPGSALGPAPHRAVCHSTRGVQGSAWLVALGVLLVVTTLIAWLLNTAACFLSRSSNKNLRRLK